MRMLMNALNAGNRSGTGRYTTELARALLQHEGEHEYSFAWPRDVAAPAPEYENNLVRKPTAPLPRLVMEHTGMNTLARRIGADILHFPTGIGPRRAALPVVLTVHDLCFFHHPEWFSRSRALYYRGVMAAGIRRADHVIADSRATAADIIRFMGIPPSRIDTVHLGVDARFQPTSLEEQKTVRSIYELPERFFLFLGTIEPRKNLRRLIDAWLMVRDSVPPLVIAGRSGWGNTTIPSEEGILRVGHIPQEHLPALYSAATAFVWPSLMEGFGLPPLEAMACGAPTLTSNTSSLPEVVGDAALQVDPLDNDALAVAMMRLAQDDALRACLREKGRTRATSFTWRATAQKTIAVYEKVYAQCCKAPG